MKKIICLLICVILLFSCVPAMAASWTPEKVTGTWELIKSVMDGVTMDEEALKEMNFSITYQFHADGTGQMTFNGTTDELFSWSIKSNKVKIHYTEYNTEIVMVPDGSLLSLVSDDSEYYYKKTKDTTSKIVEEALTSYGKFKLNNSKKTASFVSPANKKASSQSIPATIKANGKTYKVTEISAKACSGMSKLTTLTIGKNVKTIGKSAFSGCKKIKKITVSGSSLTKVGAKAFSGVPKTATVICPKKKISKYRTLLRDASLPKAVKFQSK